MIPRRRYNINFKDILQIMSFNKNSFCKLQKELELRFPNHHVLLTGSGRDALYSALNMLKNEKNELLVSSLNLKELMPDIEDLGLKINYVDTNSSYTICPQDLEKKISEDSSAILVTHLFGVPAKLDEIMEIAKKNRLNVIEDCAHLFGVTFNGEELGTIGDIGFFSFESNKPINGYGGGLLIYNKQKFKKIEPEKFYSNKLKDKLYFLKGFFKRFFEEILVRSPFYSLAHKILFNDNFRQKFEIFYRNNNSVIRKKTFNDIQAKIILKNLDYLNINQHKAKVKEFAFRKINKHIILQKKKQEYTGFYSVTGLLPEYDLNGSLAFSKYMAQRGFDVGIKSEVIDLCAPLSESSKIYERLVVLPIHEGISFQEIRRLGECINEYYSQNI